MSLVKNVIQKFSKKNAVICIIGLGYVGLPLVAALLKNKFNVLGFDVDLKKINKLKRGKSYIKNFSDQDIVAFNNTGRFDCSNNPDILSNADAILICVPTPLTKNREPDISYVKNSTIMISRYLKKGQLVVLESTTYPGTTSELILPILQKTGLVVGKDYFLAFSPEREDPGNLKFSVENTPKVVGADDEISKKIATLLYSKIVPQVVTVSSTATAEAVKITENIFRCVNIALVNELKMVFYKMGIDICEVIEAAKTKPFGFMPFYPGPGLGGHCIPIDPFYLTWKAREYGMPTRFIELAGEINTAMPEYVIRHLQEELDKRFAIGMSKSSILLIGMAYKKNIDDIRESPALIIFEQLLSKKVNVDYYDPYIPMIPNTREHPILANVKSIKLNAKSLKKYDAVILCTDHDCIDYTLLVKRSKLLIDTRNATARIGKKNNVVFA
ncbi:MAG: nucleotide sugar dehydrogenase [Coxiellaceae bacterium]|jgi:UDP-N-acetyl-D-glucosamine dehydrogenase|nr:nucleotide sugar dehydrogenase [Coxiellaceae bacterium]